MPACGGGTLRKHFFYYRGARSKECFSHIIEEFCLSCGVVVGCKGRVGVDSDDVDWNVCYVCLFFSCWYFWPLTKLRVNAPKNLFRSEIK